LLDGGLWNKFLKLSPASTIGPAYVGYLYDGKFLPDRGALARILTDEDHGALRQLAGRCPAIEWEHSGIEFARPPIFGCLAGGDIVSASSFVVWGREIAHIGVITDPSHRRGGFGKAAVSAACEDAISKGLIPQYRTLKTNTPSMEIARALGFEEYATTLCIVLGPN
jgi:RimJ/RimL family protein N-acetyltransferase